ncbi:MAG: hypothetical protein R3B08_12145 [Nitrospira sp.]
MPPIGLLMGRMDFSSLFIPLSEEAKRQILAAAKAAGADQLWCVSETLLDFTIWRLSFSWWSNK